MWEADVRPEQSAGVVDVVEQHRVNGDRDTKRDHGKTDAASSQGRKGTDGPQRRRADDAEQEAGPERHAGRGREATGDERAEPGDCVLRERYLPGVPGQDDDRE